MNTTQTAWGAKIPRTFDDINHYNAGDTVLGFLQKRARTHTYRPSKTVSYELNSISSCMNPSTQGLRRNGETLSQDIASVTILGAAPQPENDLPIEKVMSEHP